MSHTDTADLDGPRRVPAPLVPAPASDLLPGLAALVPPTVAISAVRFNEGGADDESFAEVPLPARLRAAAHRRRLHYRAGRFCALQALARLGARGAPVPEWQGPNLPPRWPDGVAGSITHTDGFAWAAAGWTRHVTALGIDSERMATSERADSVATLVCTPDELHLGLSAGFDRALTITLAFGIKEAVFKCLYPFVGRTFGYLDASLEAVDPSHGDFAVSVTRALGKQIPGRLTVKGAFRIDGDLVHAALCLPARRGTM